MIADEFGREIAISSFALIGDDSIGRGIRAGTAPGPRAKGYIDALFDRYQTSTASSDPTVPPPPRQPGRHRYLLSPLEEGSIVPELTGSKVWFFTGGQRSSVPGKPARQVADQPTMSQDRPA